jgi:hypothetical protein
MRNMKWEATISARAIGAVEPFSASSCDRKTTGTSSAGSASHDQRRTAGDWRDSNKRPSAMTT